MSATIPTVVPDGFVLHTENSAKVLLPPSNEAFLNPVQEFNRDLSIACIRVWGDDLNKEKETRWRNRGTAQKLNPQPGKGKPSISQSLTLPSSLIKESEAFVPYQFTILEALSATGLRSIRYALEIPAVRHVIANDISHSATEAMRRNVELNGLGPDPNFKDDSAAQPANSYLGRTTLENQKLGKVRIHEGDACSLMYSHRVEKLRVDVVDLDPYGTASPFLDAAVQCISDGGLLCITCTDLAVLATTNYPDKCFANYGGIPIKAEYSHESALRLVLHAVSTSAARYGRFITPLLSLSIDFYVRVFVRVQTKPIEVKSVASKTACFYVCSVCQSFHTQYLGKVVDKTSQNANPTLCYKTQTGPPVSAGCVDCGSALHFAGPMWAGPLHDPAFITRILEHLKQNAESYGTAVRMKGMLTVAAEEIESFFYFTPAKIAGTFHSNCPPLDDVASALLNAGHAVSRSHACAGSLKTSASRTVIYDVFRSWIKHHPVSLKNIKPGSPALVLLGQEPRAEADFTRHPKSVTSSASVKLVRYQQNPAPNWGPGSKSQSMLKKRKRDDLPGDPEETANKKGKSDENDS